MKYIFLLLISCACHAEMPAIQAFAMVKQEFSQDLQKFRNELRMVISNDGTTKTANILPSNGYSLITVNQKLAENPKLTVDHWTMILCHEVGHLIGGAPYIWSSPADGGEISAEGQSDYFAAAKCLRRIWKDSADNQTVTETLPGKWRKALTKQGCAGTLCQRIVSTGFTLQQVLNPKAKLSLSQPDNERVSGTRSGRNPSSPQCRVDTYLAGALCEVDPMIAFSNINQRDGACVTGPGARPDCWFNPEKLDFIY